MGWRSALHKPDRWIPLAAGRVIRRGAGGRTGGRRGGWTDGAVGEGRSSGSESWCWRSDLRLRAPAEARAGGRVRDARRLSLTATAASSCCTKESSMRSRNAACCSSVHAPRRAPARRQIVHPVHAPSRRRGARARGRTKYLAESHGRNEHRACTWSHHIIHIGMALLLHGAWLGLVKALSHGEYDACTGAVALAPCSFAVRRPDGRISGRYFSRLGQSQLLSLGSKSALTLCSLHRMYLSGPDTQKVARRAAHAVLLGQVVYDIRPVISFLLPNCHAPTRVSIQQDIHQFHGVSSRAV